MITDILDLHVHTAPSLMPRRYEDREILEVARGAGVSTVVLKAHEGSTAERARMLGEGAVGGVVLNSPVGGANPDAVELSAAMGGRLVWMPTVSAPAHIRGLASEELAVHREVRFSPVAVVEESRLREEWLPVLDAVKEHDQVLASGHLTMDETLATFEAARSRGLERFLVNHPMLPFLEWREEHRARFRSLGAHIEIGSLADHLAQREVTPTEYFLSHYPRELLVFGSDLGHSAFPDYVEGVLSWIGRAESMVGSQDLERVVVSNGRKLLAP